MYLMTQMNLEINLNILLIWREELPSSKLIISIIVFSFLFFFTSIIKNKTRIIEKELILYEKKIILTLSMETDLIKIGTSKKHSEIFKRTTSRLHEMTASKLS